MSDQRDDGDRPGLTRRSLLQTGAGAALVMIGAGAGLLPQSASARSELGEEFIHRGELRLFAPDWAPKGWRMAASAPDLRGRAIVGAGRPPASPAYNLGEHGPGIAKRRHDGEAATLSLTYLVSVENQVSEPLIGEIRPFAFGVTPEGWELCDGRELRVTSFIPLFALIGDRFGGDGQHMFGLPDLRGRTPLDHGDGPGLEPQPYARARGDLAPGGQGRRPRLHVNYCVATHGAFPSRP